MVHSRTTNWLLLGVFTVLVVLGMSHHELWLDEARSWLIAQHSAWGEIPYLAKLESHPALWYFILKCMTLLGSSVLLLQIASAAFGIAAFACVSLSAPFSRLQKLLLAINFYLLFEYTIISRNYSLECAALFALCFFARTRKPAWFFLCAAVLAQSHFYGLIWSLLLVAFSFDWLRTTSQDRKSHVAAAVYAGACITSLWVALPTHEQITATASIHMPSVTQALAVMKALLLGLFPIVSPQKISSIPGGPYAWLDSFAWIILIALLSAFLFSLRKNPRLLSLTASALAAFLILSFLRPFETLPARHLGQLTLFLIALFWLGSEQMKPRLLQSFFTIVLLIQAIAGIRSLAEDWLKPYSNGKNAALFLAQPEYAHAALLPEGPFPASSYLVYLNKPFFDFIENQKVYFTPLNNRLLQNTEVRRSEDGTGFTITKSDELFRRIKYSFCGTKADLLVVSHYKNDFMSWPNLKLQSIASFEGAIQTNENFYIYKVAANRSEFCKE